MTSSHVSFASSARRRSSATVCATALAVAATVAAVTPPASASDPSDVASLLRVTHSTDSIFLDWTATTLAPTGILDLRTGDYLPVGAEKYARVPTESAPSTAVALVQRASDGPDVALARVTLLTSEPDSEVPEIVAVTDGLATNVSWNQSHSGAPTMIAVGDEAPHPVSGSSLTVPIDLLDTTRLEVSRSTSAADGTPTLSTAGVDFVSVTEEGAATTSAATLLTTPPPYSGVEASKVTYETYIPLEKIDAPDKGSAIDCESGTGANYYYEGDGSRGNTFGASRYRTKAVVQFTWGIASVASKSVHPTVRYIKRADGTFVYDSQRTADGTKFVPRALGMTDDRGAASIQHSVGNPYCNAANTIDYENKTIVYINGAYDTQGSHDRMPNHQVYVSRKTNGTWNHVGVFNHRYYKPECLNNYLAETPYCGIEQYHYVRS